jgi:hypothetical protein
MQALRQWAYRQGRVFVFVVACAVLVGVQSAGYGVASKALDFLCGLVLGIVAAGFHYEFVDGIARLDAVSRQRAADTRREVEARVRVSITGVLAFTFTGLSAVLLLRLFV